MKKLPNKRSPNITKYSMEEEIDIFNSFAKTNEFATIIPEYIYIKMKEFGQLDKYRGHVYVSRYLKAVKAK